MENERRETPFEVWVESLTAYTEGGSRGRWISLPQTEEDLREEVNRIVHPGEEMIIMDRSTRDDCLFMQDVIGEWENIDDLNTIAKLIGDEPHPAVQAYVEMVETPSLQELANLLMQEDEIPYYAYEFEGSDNPEVMNRLSKEEKMGYTMIENNPELKSTLESLQLNETSVMNYIDVEAVGRDLSFGKMALGEEGYYAKLAEEPDLKRYTMDEIRMQLAEQEQQKKVSQAPKKERQRTPDLSPSL